MKKTLKVYADTEFFMSTISEFLKDPNLDFVQNSGEADVIFIDGSTFREHTKNSIKGKKYVYLNMDKSKDYAIFHLPEDFQVIEPHIFLPLITMDIPDDWGQGHEIMGVHVHW
jgi:hypothetical protein